ncbi:ankyrin repeat-containing domain protein [Lasiosphaeris hirsuta]|uniref:Ankyrin repeat-containing domain protein n=1 Tax=Lasiosphaeris hirsuta TaxID=260670 RepID=A0AA40BD66_9PEZI|nr:ankyrin repeat-containing domain protein [Lasiosphaeris hirsuta]
MNGLDLVKMLVENGADVGAKGPEGYSALHAAVSKGSKEIVNLLLRYGADPNAKDI